MLFACRRPGTFLLPALLLVATCAGAASPVATDTAPASAATGAPASATGAPTLMVPSSSTSATRGGLAAPTGAPATFGGSRDVAGPVFANLFPNLWTAGNTYGVTLSGANFRAGMEVRFGPGVLVKGKPVIVSPAMMKLSVTVDPAAVAGQRGVEWRASATAPWQAANTWVTVMGKPAPTVQAVARPAAKPVAPKFDINQAYTPTPGNILLEKPAWQYGGGFGGESKGTIVPMIDDATLFAWKEENPGLAESYDLRILSPAGKVLLTRRLSPVKVSVLGKEATIPAPTWYRPDAKMLDELLHGQTGQVSAAASINAGGAQPAQVNTAAAQLGPAGSGDSAQASTPAWPAGTQLLWEVSGYKKVPKSAPANAPSTPPASSGTQQPGMMPFVSMVQAVPGATPEMVEVLVSQSGRWPLKKPAKPNGFQACPLDGGGVTIYNMTQGTKGVPHPGDEWIVSGKFSLANSPYAMVSQEVKGKPPGVQASSQPGQPGMVIDVVLEHHFDNVFIDWGDGTGAQPVKVRSDMSTMGDHAVNRIETYVLPDAAEHLQWKSGKIPSDKDAPMYLTHKYAQAGSYKVRLFQLAAGDVQKANPGTLAQAVDSSGAGAGGGVFMQVAQQGRPAQPSTAAVIAERAWVVYCHTVKVEPWMDTVAQGDLQLKAVAIDRFGASAPSVSLKDMASAAKTAATGRASGVKALAGGKAMSLAPMVGTQAVIVATPDGPKEYSSHAPLLATYKVDAICSGCNKAWSAKATLEYTGTGYIDATWWAKLRSGGAPLALSDEGLVKVPASPSRTGDPSSWGAPLTGKFELVSPRLPIDPTDVYEVYVTVAVRPAPPAETLAKIVAGTQGVIDTGQLAAALGDSGDSAGAQKFGVLNPQLTATPGLPVVAYGSGNGMSGLAGALVPATGSMAGVNAASALLQPPNFVKSETKAYKVIAIDESQLCELKFAGKNGDHPLYVDQANLPKMVGDNVYTGGATLDLSLAVSPSAVKNIAVPVSFTQWTVGTDGRVAPGSVLKPTASGQDVHPRGLDGELRQVDGVAGQGIDATLRLAPSDSLLHYTQGGNAVSPAWETKAPLSPAGDWLATVKPDPDLALGWSGFYLSTPSATLDLSRSAGGAPAGCNDGTGNGWTGLNFGDATIRLNTRDLVTAQVAAPGWGVSSRACGHLDVQNAPGLQKLVVGKGEISFRRVRLDALASGGFQATYGMDVKVPFLDTTLSGEDVTLVSTGTNEGSFDFSGLKPPADIVRDFGAVHLRVPQQSVLFGPATAGWRVLTAPEITTDAEGKAFLAQAIIVPNTSFGLNGRVFFNDQTADPVRVMPLSQMAQLGSTPIELSSLRLDGGTTGSERLKLNFFGEVKMSDALPGSPVQVNYAITGDNYAGSGPWNSPFQLAMQFPEAQPATENRVSPVYAPDPQKGTRYEGEIEIDLFGGAPAKGMFVLGYNNVTDYWLMRANVPLGESGVVLYPNYAVLYAIRGGMGYHVNKTAFKSTTTLSEIQPDPSTGLMFSAGVRIGSADQFAYTFDGDILGTTSGVFRLDFGAWVLDASPTGKAPINGYFQYSAGSLDGRMWGHLGYLADLVSFDLGTGEMNAAMELHLSKSRWYLYSGKKAGPRMTATVLGLESDSYLMLGNTEGFLVGGGQHLYLGVGDSSVASAYVQGYIDMGLEITPQPKVIGDFGAGAEAGVCVVGGCASADVTAEVHAEAAPVDIRAKAKVGFPYPLPDVSFSVHL